MLEFLKLKQKRKKIRKMRDWGSSAAFGSLQPQTYVLASAPKTLTHAETCKERGETEGERTPKQCQRRDGG